MQDTEGKECLLFEELKFMSSSYFLIHYSHLSPNVGNRFAAALIDLPLWVMNVVPIHEADTLPVIFDRGLIGTYHDWCESLSTYPRTYDLLHLSFLLKSLTQRYKFYPFTGLIVDSTDSGITFFFNGFMIYF